MAGMHGDLDTASASAPQAPPEHHEPPEQAAYLALWAESGLSRAAFCREMGLREATVATWAAAATAPPPRFAPVEVVAPAPRPLAPVRRGRPRAAPASAALTLHVRLPSGVEATVTGLADGAVASLLGAVVTAGLPIAPGGALCSR